MGFRAWMMRLIEILGSWIGGDEMVCVRSEARRVFGCRCRCMVVGRW